MADKRSRYAWVIKLASLWAGLTCLFLLAAFVAGSLLLPKAVSRDQLSQAEAWWIWGCGLVALPTAILWVMILRGLAEVIVSNERGVTATPDHLRRVETLLEAVHESQHELVDLSQMSDKAKSLLFRQHEIDTIEEVLHEALIEQDFDRAEALVRDVEQGLGYTEQVRRMREEIEAARTNTVEQRVDAAVRRVNALIDAREWAQAVRQANRLIGLIPDSPKIAALPQRIREARAAHKRQLLQDYGEAVKVSDVDRSIQLLRELDSYLTPQEAAALEESARGVFKAKLHNLGVQFAICVTDGRWASAVEVGEEIIRNYPNSRMAHEVREKMGLLRTRAASSEEQPNAQPAAG
jgi:hypothetical protein